MFSNLLERIIFFGENAFRTCLTEDEHELSIIDKYTVITAYRRIVCLSVRFDQLLAALHPLSRVLVAHYLPQSKIRLMKPTCSKLILYNQINFYF